MEIAPLGQCMPFRIKDALPSSPGTSLAENRLSADGATERLERIQRPAKKPDNEPCAVSHYGKYKVEKIACPLLLK